MASREGIQACARVISVTSGKGGVGKTNIAVALASILARRGMRTLLVDADFGLANAHILLGCQVNKTVDDILFGEAKWEDVFVACPAGFDLLPSSSGVRKLIDIDAFTRRALFDKLREAMASYDVVVCDTAPGIGDSVLEMNAEASDIVVVAHPEPTALADAYALIKVLATEKKEKKFRLVVNRSHSMQEGLDSYRKLTEVSDEFLNVSVDYLGSIPEDVAVGRAARGRKSVIGSEPYAPFSVSMERIADKLLASGSPMKTWDTRSVENLLRVGGQT